VASARGRRHVVSETIRLEVDDWPLVTLFRRCALKWLIEVAEGIGAMVALIVAAILWFAQSSIESLIEVKRAGKGKRS
jgi:hypothetical protein